MKTARKPKVVSRNPMHGDFVKSCAAQAQAQTLLVQNVTKLQQTMIVALTRGTPISTPKYCDPYYWDPLMFENFKPWINRKCLLYPL